MAADTPARNLRTRRSKPEMYGEWVETPSKAANGSATRHANGKANGVANGVANGDQLVEPDPKAKALAKKAEAGITEHGRKSDRLLDTHQSYEFGGPIGVSAMMIGFPLLMYYLWICLWYYQGKFVYPTSLADIRPFFGRMWAHCLDGAYPTAFALKSYLGLFAVQLLFAAYLPGIEQHGLPVPSLDYKALPYLCNALYSWYTTLVVAAALNYTGIYRLPWIIENIGSIMTVAIATSFVCAALVEFFGRTANWGGKPIRMSGVWVYDHFMGITLNPRLGPVDLKMFAEVRVPWVLLFLISISGAVKQYEEMGYVTYNMLHHCLATGLYINACAKAEQMIPMTWDMFHEKFGWMLIFWNMAGVPFTYCYPVIYMVRSSTSTYEYGLLGKVVMFVTLITCYTIFDGSMSQKSTFKMQEQGTYKPRYAWPIVPWAVVKNPTYIQTKHGNKLLTCGWWQFARKINYTADWFQALTWGLCGGLNTPITLFYPIFFFAVLVHRCGRDFEKCSRKYGDDWKRYCEAVPYKFIPYVY